MDVEREEMGKVRRSSRWIAYDINNNNIINNTKIHTNNFIKVKILLHPRKPKEI